MENSLGRLLLDRIEKLEEKIDRLEEKNNLEFDFTNCRVNDLKDYVKKYFERKKQFKDLI